MVELIEVAKFLAGVLAWDAFVHLSFLRAGIEPKLLGIHFTHRFNKMAIVLNSVIALALIYISWFRGA